MTSSQLLGLQVNVAMPIFFDVHVGSLSSGLHAYAVNILPTQPSPRLPHVNSNPKLCDYGFITELTVLGLLPTVPGGASF